MMSRAGNLEICKARFSTFGCQCSGTVAAAGKAVSVMDAQFLAEVISCKALQVNQACGSQGFQPFTILAYHKQKGLNCTYFNIVPIGKSVKSLQSRVFKRLTLRGIFLNDVFVKLWIFISVLPLRKCIVVSETVTDRRLPLYYYFYLSMKVNSRD